MLNNQRVCVVLCFAIKKLENRIDSRPQSWSPGHIWHQTMTGGTLCSGRLALGWQEIVNFWTYHWPSLAILQFHIISIIANILSKTLGASEFLILPSAPASLKPCCCLLALAICGTEGLCEASLRAQKLKVNGGLHKCGHPKIGGFSLTLLLKLII